HRAPQHCSDGQPAAARFGSSSGRPSVLPPETNVVMSAGQPPSTGRPFLAEHFIGIDVGTGSARAGIFDRRGRMAATAKRDIALYQDGPDIAEQSSEDIWQAVCAAVREAMALAGIAPNAIAGIGFDATCSLVVLGPGG